MPFGEWRFWNIRAIATMAITPKGNATQGMVKIARQMTSSSGPIFGMNLFLPNFRVSS